MTQDIALLRFRAARNHRENDAEGMSRTARDIVSMGERCLDERQSTFVLRAMGELLGDAAVAVDRMRSANAKTSFELAETAANLATMHGTVTTASMIIERNPAATLDQLPLSSHVLRTMLDLDGRSATVEEIAERAGRTIDAVRDIMHAIHWHGHAVLTIGAEVRRYALSTKGLRASLFIPDKQA